MKKLLAWSVPTVLLVTAGFAVTRRFIYQQDLSAQVATAIEQSIAKSIFVDPMSQTLDPAAWGSTLYCKIDLVNRSDSAITIDSVKGTCDCTVLEESYDGKAIQAGDRLSLAVRIKLGWSPTERTVAVKITLASGQILEPQISFTTVGSYVLSKEFVNFGEHDVQSDEAKEAMVVFTPRDEIEFVDAYVKGGWASAKLSRQSDGAVRILITCDPSEMHVGQLLATLIIETTDERKPREYNPLKSSWHHRLFCEARPSVS